MIKLWQGVAMRTGCDSQAGSIPTGLIVQFSDRTQLAMTPSDTGRASKSLWRNKVDAMGDRQRLGVEATVNGGT